jgi:hypothetical protein
MIDGDASETAADAAHAVAEQLTLRLIGIALQEDTES